MCADSCVLQVAPQAPVFATAVSGPEKGILQGRRGNCSAPRSRYASIASINSNSSKRELGRHVGERLLAPFRHRLLLQTQSAAVSQMTWNRFGMFSVLRGRSLHCAGRWVPVW